MNNKGFTLVEITIVAGLTTMLILAAVSLLLSTIVSSGRSNAVQFVRENGDYAIGQMEFLLRNAIEIQGVCTTGMTSLTVRAKDTGLTTFQRVDISATDSRIASTSASVAYLTSDAVRVTVGPTFDCYQSSDGLIKTVKVSFTIGRGSTGVDRESDIATQQFQTTVSLRNF